MLLAVTMESLGEQSGCKRKTKFKAMELKVLLDKANDPDKVL